MFERFSERGRQVVVLSQDEARALRHNYIGTEHLLLGLLRVQEGIAARALDSLGIPLEGVREQVGRIVGQGDETAAGQIPLTPRAKKVLELALREALALEHNYIGPEHVLLGLVRENQGVAARILLDFGADADNVRNTVTGMLSAPERNEYAEKEAAIARMSFEEAAQLHDRELDLGPGASGFGQVVEAVRGAEQLPLVAAIAFAAASFPLGLFVGWLIWG